MAAIVELCPARRTPRRQLAHPAAQVLMEAGRAVPLPGWGGAWAQGDAPELPAAPRHTNGVRAPPPAMVGSALSVVAVGASAPAPGAPAAPGPTPALAAAAAGGGGGGDDKRQGSGENAGGGARERDVSLSCFQKLG